MPKQTPSAPDDNGDENEIIVPASSGEPVSIEVPEGTRQITINVDPALLGQQPPRRGCSDSFLSGCGCLAVGGVVLWFVFYAFAYLGS